MAAIIVPFQPSATAPFTFNATFDNAAYNVSVTWLYTGQRYYVNIYSTQGALVVALPLIASPDDYNISMTAGYFTTPLVYRASSNSFEIGS